MKILGLKLIFCFSIILGSFFLAGKVSAATVYVSSSATNGYAIGNDANSYAQAQSKSTPLLTVTGALSKVASGDTIVINDGTYIEAAALVAADDNLTLTNDPVTGATNGVVIRVSSGARIFHATYVSPGAGFTFGPIVLDSNNTQANVVTCDGSNDIGLLTFNGTSLLNPTLYWVNGSGHLRNLEMTGAWSASASNGTAKGGFVLTGASASNGTYNMSGGIISVTNAGAVNSYILRLNPAVAGLTVNFTNNNITMAGASASTTHTVIYIETGSVTANINGNNVDFTGTASSVYFINTSDKAVALTAASNDIIASGTLANVNGIWVSGLASANIYSNTFDNSGATISTSAYGIVVGNGTGITSSCSVHDNSGDLNTTEGIVIIIGDDADPDANDHHITDAVVYNNNFSNTNHGYLAANVTGAHIYNNVIDNAVIGVASKYSINNRFDNNILKNITTGGALREKGSSGSVFYNNTVTLANGGIGILNTNGTVTATYKNNILYTDQANMQFVRILADSATLANNIYYSTQSLPADAWQVGATTYNNFASWQAAGFDANSLNSNPVFVNAASDYHLQATSPAIDAGANVSLTSDYSGNSIYGLPDMGVYEYQPPYTFSIDDIFTTGSVRLYSNGKYRMLTAASGGATGIFSVAPINNVYDSTTTRYMDITIDSWLTSGTRNKQWTASSTAGDLCVLATSTVYTIGDLTASKYYTFLVDSAVSTAITGYGTTVCTSGICLSDGSGQMQFTYTGGYSTAHTFALQQDDTAISDVLVTNINTTSAVITWTTNHAADSKVNYGLTSSYGQQVSESGLSISHSLTLTGLTPGATYHYQVVSTGNTEASSVDATFTTLAATVITNVQVTQITATSVLITWTTNHPATSLLNYGLTLSYGQQVSDSALVTSHSVTITGLTAGATYHFQVASVGNTGASSVDSAFDTLAVTVITNVQATVLSATSVRITWTTNHAADSKIFYGFTSSYGLEISDSNLVTSHLITITGLTAGAIYHFQVASTGNTASYDTDKTFILAAGSVYLASPTIILPAAGSTISIARPTITGLARAKNTIFIFIDENLENTVLSTSHYSNTGSFYYKLRRDLSPGRHSLYTIARNADGVYSARSPKIYFTVALPYVPPTLLEPFFTDGENPTVIIRGVALNDSLIKVYLDGAYISEFGVTNSLKNNTASFTYTLPLSDLSVGQHSITTIAFDSSGKASNVSNAVSFTKTEASVAANPTSYEFTDGVVYQVAVGDSLWIIAQRFYGAGYQFTKIIDGNKLKFPSLLLLPNVIKAGWQLSIA